jgi:hypothetical protein
MAEAKKLRESHFRARTLPSAAKAGFKTKHFPQRYTAAPPKIKHNTDFSAPAKKLEVA